MVEIKRPLKIIDRTGVLPVAVIRENFEKAVANTKEGFLSSNVVLDPVIIDAVDGAFVGYKDADTDALWIGFALGMRCAERLMEAGQL